MYSSFRGLHPGLWGLCPWTRLGNSAQSPIIRSCSLLGRCSRQYGHFYIFATGSSSTWEFGETRLTANLSHCPFTLFPRLFGFLLQKYIFSGWKLPKPNVGDLPLSGERGGRKNHRCNYVTDYSVAFIVVGVCCSLTVWWHVSATLFFSATTHYFFQKILCCGHGAQHNIFWKIMCCVSKNNVLWQTYHNTLFFAKKYCVADMAHNTIFLWKNNVLWLKNCQRQSCSAINCLSSGINMLCCLKFVTTHYFLSHNTLFFQKNILLCSMSATQYFLKKIMCYNSRCNSPCYGRPM